MNLSSPAGLELVSKDMKEKEKKKIQNSNLETAVSVIRDRQFLVHKVKRQREKERFGAEGLLSGSVGKASAFSSGYALRILGWSPVWGCLLSAESLLLLPLPLPRTCELSLLLSNK